MTRIRFKHFLEVPDGEYELIRFDDDAHYVVRDEGGDVLTAERDSPPKVVEIKCDFCGRWSDDVGPFGEELWMCNFGNGPCPA